MLVLLFVALWFVLRGDSFCVLPCVVLFLCFSVLLALRFPRLGRDEWGGGWSWCFCAFVPFALVLFYLFPLPLGVWEGLRL